MKSSVSIIVARAMSEEVSVGTKALSTDAFIPPPGSQFELALFVIHFPFLLCDCARFNSKCSWRRICEASVLV
jgi:hypothetical protein